MERRPLIGKGSLRALDRPGLSIAAVFVGVAHLWMLPLLAVHSGGGLGLLVWLLIALLLGGPLVVYELAIGTCFQGPLPDCLRRVHRHLEWLGWWANWLALFLAVLFAAVAAWSLVLTFEAVINLLTGRASPWRLPLADTKAYVTGALGGSSESANVLRPQGIVVVVAAFLWLLLHRILRKGIEGFTAFARAVLPSLAGLTIILLVLVVTAPRASAGIERFFVGKPGQLSSASAWATIVSTVVVAAGIGSGALTAIAGSRARTSDSAGLTLAFATAAIILQVLLLVLVAGSIGVAAVDVRSSIDTLIESPLDVLLFIIPRGFAAAAGSGWRSSLGVILAGCLISGIALLGAAALLLGPVIGVRQAFRSSEGNAATEVCVLGLLFALIFAGGLGPIIWEQSFASVRSIQLPLVVMALCIAGALRLGLDGLSDHVKAYSAVPVGRLWRLTVGSFVPIVMAVAIVIGFAQLRTQLHDATAWLSVIVPIFLWPLLSLLTVWRRRRQR